MARVRKFLRFLKGFTLIELLIAIGIVGVLAVSALVALDPGKRLADARDAVRWQDINALREAEELYRADNGIFLPAVDILLSNTNYMIGTAGAGTTERIAGVGCDVYIGAGNGVNLADLKPQYLAQIPVASKAAGGVAWSVTETGYYLRKSATGALLVIGACDAEGTNFIATAVGGDTVATGGAPLRSGQPYAEATKCADPNVLLCEDFDYVGNFPCGGAGGWINPGLSSYEAGDFCGGHNFPLLSTLAGVPAPPVGSPSGPNNRVFRSNLQGASTYLNGCLLGDCNRDTGDTPATYKNGTAATGDLYIRVQLFRPEGYPWPTWDNKFMFLYPNRFTSRPEANIDGGSISCTGPTARGTPTRSMTAWRFAWAPTPAPTSNILPRTTGDNTTRTTSTAPAPAPRTASLETPRWPP